MSLNKLLSNIDKFQNRTITVDLSEFGGEGAEITLREPNVSELILVANDIPNYQKKYPDLPIDLIFNIALMASCHVSPEPEPETAIGNLYVNLATEFNPLAFLKMQTEFRREFVWVDQYLASVGNKKK